VLSRHWVSSLENDKRWSINTLDYEVRTYPDNQSAEITGTTAPDMFTGVAFLLKIEQEDDGFVHAEIAGVKKESLVAWKYLTMCAEQEQ
jgi:hypothetical protein